jgi:hypothetical protein
VVTITRKPTLAAGQTSIAKFQALIRMIRRPI